MLLSDEEEWRLWNAQGIDDMNQADAIAFARAYAAAILAKLASAELPATVWVDVPHFTYTADQLHQAHAQGFAAGAASQLAETPSAWAMRDALDELLANGCTGITVGFETDWRKVPLYTRREA